MRPPMYFDSVKLRMSLFSPPPPQPKPYSNQRDAANTAAHSFSAPGSLSNFSTDAVSAAPKRPYRCGQPSLSLGGSSHFAWEAMGPS